MLICIASRNDPGDIDGTFLLLSSHHIEPKPFGIRGKYVVVFFLSFFLKGGGAVLGEEMPPLSLTPPPIPVMIMFIF